jgi:hypothetical protein
MAVNQLYDTWLRQVRQLWPDFRRTLVRNMAWCLCGKYLSRSVQLQHIASHTPSWAKLVSVTRRLSRFLHRGVSAGTSPVRPLGLVLAPGRGGQCGGEIHFIVESTQVSAHLARKVAHTPRAITKILLFN